MHSNLDNHTDDKVYQEVKECADNGDIRGLRYIFLSSLDVDPTFKKYERSFEDYKELSGLFVPHTDKGLMPLVDNCDKWNSGYWNQLKVDLLENFSKERFQHMREVAKVVYAEKILRLEKEQSKVETITKSSIVSQGKEHGSKEVEQLNYGLRRKAESKPVTNFYTKENVLQDSATHPSSTQKREIEEKKRRLIQEGNAVKELNEQKSKVRKNLIYDDNYEIILKTETQWFSYCKEQLKVTIFGDREIEEVYYKLDGSTKPEKNLRWKQCIGKEELDDYQLSGGYDERKIAVYYEVRCHKTSNSFFGKLKNMVIPKQEVNYYQMSSYNKVYEIQI